MDRLIWEAAGSLILLLAAFICMYLAIGKRTSFARYSLVILFAACGTPLPVMLISNERNEYIGANIGLGLAFFLTWGITAAVLLASLIIWAAKKRKKT